MWLPPPLNHTTECLVLGTLATHESNIFPSGVGCGDNGPPLIRWMENSINLLVESVESDTEGWEGESWASQEERKYWKGPQLGWMTETADQNSNGNTINYENTKYVCLLYSSSLKSTIWECQWMSVFSETFNNNN